MYCAPLDRLRWVHDNRPMWTPADVPDLHGRVVVVTGANGGLGLEVARALAGKGATVVMAARKQDKLAEAQQAVAAEAPGATLDPRELDLASLDSVRASADGIAADHERIDVLVNNAGVMGVPEQATADGFEMQLGVNHLGHFVLTRRLLPALLAAPVGRVVSVTSFGRFIGRVRADNPHLRGRYGPWTAYGQAKLANLLFAVELQRRLAVAGAAVRSVVAHPGLSHTDLQARSVRETGGGFSQRFWHTVAGSVGMPPERAAQSLLRAATDPAAAGGDMYGPRWMTFGPPVRRPVLGRPGRSGEDLWLMSERETGERFDVAAIARGAG
jgi:NAD(P)-dependent dehydrogenase (short-subunit alcohol dehydrogenase family)